MSEYQDAAYQYCRKVLNGEIISCHKIKQMANRHLNDLERQGDEDFSYFWDADIAKKADIFIQSVPDPDVGQPIPLALYQRALFQMILAWRKNDGRKRWSKGVFSVSRHNGKTQFASNLATYEFLFGTPKHNRQIICAGQSNETANHILSYCKDALPYILKKMKNEKLSKMISINEHEIKINGANTFVKKLSSESKSLFGYHPTFVACDEYHTMKDRTFVQKLSSGMLFNDALFLIISTCGADLKSPMYQDYEHLWTPILDGKIKQDDYFVAIYEQDADDEAYQPETWEKSNPLFAIKSVREDSIDKFISERDVNVQQNNLAKFINQNMNRWKSLSDKSLINNIEDWKESTNTNFDIRAQPCYIGIDMSMTGNDNSTVAFVFPYQDSEGNKKWHLKQHSFIGMLPGIGIEGKEKKDGISYRRLERKGEVSITKLASGYIDPDAVFQYICNFVDDNNLNVIGVFYDPYGMNSIISKMENDLSHQWNLVEVKQNFQTLKDPTNQFVMLFDNHQITHDDDEMLAGAFNNAVIVENQHGLKIDKYKNKAGFRIDPADAVIDTFVKAGFYFDEDHDDLIYNMTNDELNDFFKSNKFSF
ncbi:terminase large subunit [Sporolactobacillus shoreicorticis]|uniref:Terminase large subunit n=1 Tax=Sporolactobacillus shoreicorticis TaxID=1923877 RepID=A0ABW5S7R8_9BACL|nr:terminase TerL endonuclease subunit [Sporolactobacillus shoreicorticis]MCO7126629.1 terminase large subunit [Sporolactobacillus shoreicorticis]